MRVPALPSEEEAREGGRFPEGAYPVRIVDASEKTASTGTPGVEVTFQVVSGGLKGRQIYDTIWVTEKALGMARMRLSAVGYPIPEGEDFELNPAELLSRTCVIRVQDETFEGVTRSKVKGWFSDEGAANAHPDQGKLTPDHDDIPF